MSTLLSRFLLSGVALAMVTGQSNAESAYLQQFGPGDYAYDLAVEMEAHGCTMTEAAMADFLQARGAFFSDVQATIMNLARAGNLASGGNASQGLTLVGWGRCR